MSNDGGMFSKLLDSDKPRTKIQIKEPITPSPVIEPPIISAEKGKTKELDHKNLPKKQISAYLSIPQHTIFKQLYHKLNSTEANIDKSEIVGLSLEILATVIADETPNYPTLLKLKEYLEQKVSKHR